MRRTRDLLPFDWMDPKRARKYEGRTKPDAMYLAELRDRAALLRRLNYDRAFAKARLRANVAWDFELHPAPAFAAKIDSIVDEVYGRGGTPGGPPTL